MEKKKNRRKFCHRRCWQTESTVCGLRQKQHGLPDRGQFVSVYTTDASKLLATSDQYL